MSISTRYFALGAAGMLVGLAVHFQGSSLSANARDVIGDVLWATMMASFVSAIVPWQQPWKRYVTALVLCYAVELSQLWQLAALRYVRSTPLGRLVPGSGFDPRDFAAYALGILVFVTLDRRRLIRRDRARA